MSIFSTNLVRKPKTSVFGMSHTNTLTFDAPYLVPVLCEEVIPGDKWKISTEVFLRMMPMLAPIMQDVDVYVHYFYHPLRLVIKDYDSYFNPETQEDVVRPFIDLSKFVLAFREQFNYNTIPVDPSLREPQMNHALSYLRMVSEGSLADYLGIPVLNLDDPAYMATESDVVYYNVRTFLVDLAKMPKFSAIPFVMYQIIYREFYRDQTLEDDPLLALDDYSDGFGDGRFSCDEIFNPTSLASWSSLLTLRTRAWRKDYFTSALPTPQAGPDVHLPMSGDAPVKLVGDMTALEAHNEQQLMPVSSYPQTNEYIQMRGLTNAQGTGARLTAGIGDNTRQAYFDPGDSMIADLSNVTSATINELRRAVRAQEFLEKCARGGRRYIEMILSHFGVRSSDARLDRPEFIGGGRQPFTISEVLSHVGEAAKGATDFVLGDMGGHGLSYGQSSYTRRFFEEHGFVYAILSVLPKASYQQGLHRKFTRESLFDYAWPSFANLGEQEILNKEIYAFQDDADKVFGYAPRYSEYKYIPSSVHGAMRSSLNYWHLGRIFASAPALNADFVHPRPEELKRIFAVNTEDHSMLGLIKHHITVSRRLPKYGIPTL